MCNSNTTIIVVKNDEHILQVLNALIQQKYLSKHKQKKTVMETNTNTQTITQIVKEENETETSQKDVIEDVPQKKEKKERKKMSEEERKKRRNERDRKKYAENEEYRLKKLAQNKHYWKELQENTEKRLLNLKRVQERYYTEIKPKKLLEIQQQYQEKLRQLEEGTYIPPRRNNKKVDS